MNIYSYATQGDLGNLIIPIFSFLGGLLVASIGAWVGWGGHKISQSNAELNARLTANVKLAEFRQAWIDSLRSDMADFISLALIIDPSFKMQPDVSKIATRIELHLKPDDPELPALRNSMLKFGAALTRDDKQKANDEYVPICQKIIKREWEELKNDVRSVTSEKLAHQDTDPSGQSDTNDS